MINGFDNETAPLTDIELDMLPSVIGVLKSRYGKESAITNKNLRESFPDLTDARVRKLINHIRNNNLVPCLIATSKGYYVASTEQELRDYEDSLRARADAIMSVCESIKQQRTARFGGPHQLSLF